MADVIEVIHKINYEVNDAALQNVAKVIMLQAKEVKNLTASLQHYQKELNDPKNAKSFTSISTQITNITQQIEIAATKSKSLLASVGQGVANGLGIPTNTAEAVAMAVNAVKDFAIECGNIAAEVDKIKPAFERLNDPTLLEQLRTTTQNTVSDLELMQKAVQYEKIGILIEHMATALDYAQRYAKQTGQNVDDVVQAIAKGIKDESLNALEQLGLKTEDIGKEFIKTKDFATAAFTAINEQTDKSIDYLDDYERKQNEVNTSIANAKAGFGEYVNYAKGAMYAMLQDLGDILTSPVDYIKNMANGGLDNYQKYVLDHEKHEKAEKVKQNISEKGYEIYLKNFKGFADDYVKADARMRERIVKQAKEAQLNLIKQLGEQYQGVPGSEETIKAFVNEAFRFFTTQESKPANKPNKLSSTKKSVSKPKSLPKEEIDSIPTIWHDINTIPDASAFQPKSASAPKPKTEEELKKERRKEFLKKAEKTVFGDTANIEDPEERRRQEIKKSISAYTSLVDTAVQAYQTITEAQIKALDKEIEIRQKRIDAATKLAERGNTEALRIEEERLAAAEKKRDEYAKRQAIINSALAVSNAIVAVAEAAAQSGVGAIATVPAVIAAIVAGYAAISSATRESGSFKDGVVDFQGKGTGTSDSNVVRISHGESVITAAGTQRNKEVLEAINRGAVFNMLQPSIKPMYMPAATQGMGGYASRGELKGLEKKMDTLIDTVAANGTTVHARMDERGMSLMTVKQIRREHNRFK